MRPSLVLVLCLLALAHNGNCDDPPTKPLPIRLTDSVEFMLPTGESSGVIVAKYSRLISGKETKKELVTKTRRENRVRTVTTNGVTTQVPYVVEVPYTELVERPITTLRRDKPLFVPLHYKDIEAWDRNGRRLEFDELVSLLPKSPPAIKLRESWPKGAKIDPAELAVLREDILFVFSKKLK